MERYPVHGRGDMEDRRPRPRQPRILDAIPGPHNPAASLAEYIMEMMKRQKRQYPVQYFNPNTDLGKLQESFGVFAPWASPYFANRLQ